VCILQITDIIHKPFSKLANSFSPKLRETYETFDKCCHLCERSYLIYDGVTLTPYLIEVINSFHSSFELRWRVPMLKQYICKTNN
jgi:hypothetical protein